MFIVILGILIIVGFFFLKLACAVEARRKAGRQVSSTSAA